MSYPFRFITFLIYFLTCLVNADDIYRLNVGSMHTCTSNDIRNEIFCWGSDSYGQATVPNFSENIISVAVGRWYSCALLDNNDTQCWGAQTLSQFNPPILSNPTAIDSSAFHLCVFDDTGVVCWGNRQDVVPNLINPSQISLTGFHSCALDDTGVVCWDENDEGQATVPSLNNPIKLSSGSGGVVKHTCVIDSLSAGSEVICWGLNDYGQTDVPSLQNPSEVAVGGDNTCAIDDTGVVCWGRDVYGINSPPTLINPTQIVIGQFHACAVDASGIKCWGRNDMGQTDVPLTLQTSDDDNDGIYNTLDNCPNIFNPYQYDLDNDNIGDACDNDGDGDGVDNSIDVDDTNPLLAIDPDNDLIDSSGILNYAQDNCPNTSNPNQLDLDEDGIGDVCDNDKDGDGFNASFDANDLNRFLSTDPDNDGVDSSGLEYYRNNVCLRPPGCNDFDPCATVCYEPTQDNCPVISNTSQSDIDNDNQGDACDSDIDGDGFENEIELAAGGDANNASDYSDVKENILAALNANKHVPAIGGIGLLALGLSMLGLGAVRLRKK